MFHAEVNITCSINNFPSFGQYCCLFTANQGLTFGVTYFHCFSRNVRTRGGKITTTGHKSNSNQLKI